MKSRENLIRLKRFQVEEKRRQVMQIEGMVVEFERIAADLSRDILLEQERTGISDPEHFAYSTYAKAAIARRDNLKRSAGELAGQMEDAKLALAESLDELKKMELIGERERTADEACERVELASIGALAARA